MSKFDNSMFKTWQHILNVEDKNKENENKKELFIREDERHKIANRLLELGIEKEIIFKATGIDLK
ncbi:hypothetical protein QYB59_000346 [Clostridium perfringens]|nr:hypothetical protein [Clostridium perfringens]